VIRNLIFVSILCMTQAFAADPVPPPPAVNAPPAAQAQGQPANPSVPPAAVPGFPMNDASSAVPPPAAAAAAPKDPSEEVMKIRDPFKKPSTLVVEVPKSELEQFPVEKLKMLGIVSGLPHLKAMISAPNNRTYFVGENTKIGVRNGFIRKISAECISVREKVLNVLGKEENADVDLCLAADKQQTLGSGYGW
jgi:glucose/arabinose dehydrogenase